MKINCKKKNSVPGKQIKKTKCLNKYFELTSNKKKQKSCRICKYEYTIKSGKLEFPTVSTIKDKIFQTMLAHYIYI